MKEKILVRFLIQFLILCIFRVILMDEALAELNLMLLVILLSLSAMITLVLESFDYLIVSLGKKAKLIFIVMLLVFLYVLLVNQVSTYYFYILGYMSCVMLKDISKVYLMQIALVEYQKENSIEN